jgi:hypothetical protein
VPDLDPEDLDPAERDPAGRDEGGRPLTVLVPRDHDALPRRSSSWRAIRAWFAVPATAALPEAAAVQHVFTDPELHWAPGLRRGTLAVLPSPSAFTRALLAWEWSIDAADFSVSSAEPTGWSADETRAVEAWLRAAAAALQQQGDRIDDDVRRVVDDVAAGHDETRPVAAGSARLVEARLGTGVEGPAVGAAHPRVDVVLPASDDPGREVFVDTADGAELGERRTVAVDGEPVAFRYTVADGVDDVTPRELARWHDQHLQRLLLADDARQAAVHVVAGIAPPASVGYGA